MKNLFIPLLLTFFGISSCSKKDSAIAISETAFNSDVLNKNVIVSSAIDNGADMTQQFNSYTFRFTNTSNLSGSLTASNDLLNFNGLWSVSSDFANLTISFPANVPSDFNFLNNTWKITAIADIYFYLKPANGENKILNFTQKK